MARGSQNYDARGVTAAASSLTFSTLTSALGAYYGELPLPSLRDPFARVLYEQVAYLATDAVRMHAFELLRTTVGLTTAAILDAPDGMLENICRAGGAIAVETRATRMRASARLANKRWQGDLHGINALDERDARSALQQFPMIGEPAADHILVLMHKSMRVPLDSNALRVLGRTGLIEETADYRATYRAAQQRLARDAPADAEQRLYAGALVRQHGLTLCKRRAPRCGHCPVVSWCPAAEIV